MTKRMIAAQLSVGALLLVLVALMESYTGWDTAAQRLWFDSATRMNGLCPTSCTLG